MATSSPHPTWDRLDFKPGAPPLFRGEVSVLGPVLLGQQTHKVGFGDAEGDLLVQEPEEPVKSNMHSDLWAPLEQG